MKPAIFGASVSSQLTMRSIGFAVRKAKPRIFLRSSSDRSSSRIGFSRSSPSRQRRTTGSSSSSSLFFAFLMFSSSLSSRRCATSRSASISSVSRVAMSRRGSIGPSLCGIASSRKARTTWAIASTLRISLRSTELASPFCRPWMSRKSTWAKVVFFGLNRTERRSRRGSGTFATPTFGSDLPVANRSTATWAPVKMLNRVVLPTLGYPSMPIFNASALLRSWRLRQASVYRRTAGRRFGCSPVRLPARILA